MGSLAKEYSGEKLLGQVYTPAPIVCKILDELGFNTPDVLGRTILDPACGDGRFLEEIVKRIIKFSPTAQLSENLKCVYGWDIDQTAIEIAINNLNRLIEPFDLSLEWNICCENSISKIEKQTLFSTNTVLQRFDFIIGNPPYVRIQHLDIDLREYIKSNYSFCNSGSTDLYIAFFELCKSLLSETGKCGLITPNTFFYTETAKSLRQYFVSHRNLIKIINYGFIQLFDDATTYSAITIFDRQSRGHFQFEKATSLDCFEKQTVDFRSLSEPFWQLSTDHFDIGEGVKLGSLAKIHVGITTLCDKVYIFGASDLDEKYVLARTKVFGDVKLEKAILKPIIKGSTLKNKDQSITEWVLFPYHRVSGKHTIISESELETKFPFAYKYLCSVKNELDKRDNGKPNPVAWYAFGRSQGLDTSFGKKIIFSPMNQKPNFVYYENEDCTFYSGYCIKRSNNLKELLPQLNSERMRKFIEISSRDYRGGWKAYNKKVVENYMIELK